MQVGGANIVKLNPQFLQTMQVGETGQNTEAGGKSPYNNVRVGGAQHRSWRKVSFYEYYKKLGNKMLPNFIFKIINPI